MSFLQSIILGIIQGITEFLPVSSSAHLVLVPHILNWSIPENQIFPFDVLVQLGTLSAVIIYFRKDLWQILKALVQGLVQRKPFAEENSRLGWYLVLATIPAGLAGVFLKDRVEAAFNDPRLTAFFLFITAIFLVAAEFFGRRSRQLGKMTWKDALWMGIFQAFSIFPGISRSGSTITGGMTRNFDRPSAARFAFLMSIPIMIAAGVFSLPDLIKVPDLRSFLPIVLAGFLVAGVVGYLTIHWLLSFLTRRSLLYFAAYCVLLGSAVLIVMGIRQTGQTGSPALSQKPAPVGVSVPPQGPVAIQETLSVDISPALDWLRPQISACTASIPGLSMLEYDTLSSEAASEIIELRWGEPPQLTRKAVVIAEDELVFVVNPENPVQELPLPILKQLVSDKTITWGQVQLACPECFSSLPADDLIDEPVRLLLYPQGDEIRAIFEECIFGNTPFSGASLLTVPSPAEMLNEVATTIQAIGFVPAQSANTTIRVITITDNLKEIDFHRPILAISDTQPQGLSAKWLACLQDSVSQR